MTRAWAFGAVVLVATLVGRAQEPTIPTRWSADAGAQSGESAADGLFLQALLLERRVRDVAKRVSPATVGLRIGGSQGSGVIVSADGYVITAAHLYDDPGEAVRAVLQDGRVVQARTLGREETGDFALMKITEEGEWPFVELGSAASLDVGDPCVATGHPGGFQRGRPPVLRFGFVTSLEEPFIRSTCIINRGDSGGPLFDLDGRVIGIHSRIQERVTGNFHVSVDRYRQHWERLVAGDSWGKRPVGREPRFDSGPTLGIRGRDDRRGCRVRIVHQGHAAAAAGMKVGDVILALDGETISGVDSLADAVQERESGDRVLLKILRDDAEIELEAVLGHTR